MVITYSMLILRNMKVSVILVLTCIVSVRNNPVISKNTFNSEVNSTEEVYTVTEKVDIRKVTEAWTILKFNATARKDPIDEKLLVKYETEENKIKVAYIPEFEPKLTDKVQVANISTTLNKPTSRTKLLYGKKRKKNTTFSKYESSHYYNISHGSKHLFDIEGCPTGYDRSDSGECVEIEL